MISIIIKYYSKHFDCLNYQLNIILPRSEKHMCVYKRTNIHICTPTHTHMYVQTDILTHTYTHTHTYIYSARTHTHKYVYIYMCVCVCVCVCSCVQTHTYIHTRTRYFQNCVCKSSPCLLLWFGDFNAPTVINFSNLYTKWQTY